MQFALKLLFLLAVGACGPRPGVSSSLSEQTSDWGDTTALKSQCFALATELEKSVRVDYDDQAEVRLCAHLQTDGQMALELRYHPDRMPTSRLAALVHVRNAQGQQAEGLFPLSFQTLTQSHELYLSRGCLLGRIGGCARQSTPAMRELFAPLRSEEGAMSYESFLVEVSLLTPQMRNLDSEELNQLPRYRVVIPAL